MTILRALFLSSFVLLALLVPAQAATTINYPLLGRGTGANRTLTGWATIVSDSGPVASGANAPRLYFKKSTDADAFVGNTVTDNGWKYVTATGGSGGAYSFVIDYSIIFGGSVNEGTPVSFGDTIQYFVVAQDEADNLVSSPAGAAASANPPVPNISAKPTSGVNSYQLLPGIGGTVTVPGTFPSITGTEGLCVALSARPLNGNVTVKIVSDLTEGGAVPTFRATMANDYPNTCTVTIQPDSATMRTISGSSRTISVPGNVGDPPTTFNSFLFLVGAQRVIIDGSFGGSGRYLTFRNTNPAGPTFTFREDASNNTVRNCVIEGAGQTGDQNTEVTASVVFFGTGITTGNDNNTITGNQIRDLSDRVGVPAMLVGSRADSTTVMNSGNTLSNNELFNFTDAGVNMPFTGAGNGLASNESWTITGNTIYQTTASTGNLFGISYDGYGTNTIRDNIVHDLTTTGGAAVGMGLKFRGDGATVAGNRVWNINAAFLVYGILCDQFADGSATLVNNTVTLGADIPQTLIGLAVAAGSGSGGSTNITTLAAHNTVLIIGDGGTGADSFAFYAAQPATVKNNLFLNLRAGGGSHYAAASNTGLALAMDGNVYAGTGSATATDFFVSVATVSPFTKTPMSFEQWKQFVNGDANSHASNPGGDYSSALFANPANGDLHLAGESPLVIAAGVPLAEVTTDFDGNPRHNPPDIGADESTTVPQLSGLVLSGVTFTPDFAPRTPAYSATVPNLTAATTVTPTAVQASSIILVNGNAVASGATSGSLALDVGQNTINTVVSGFNGTRVKTYTVFITRPPSSNADLSSLALSAGTLDPVFASGTLNYGASVPFDTTSLTVTPTAAEGNATIKVNTTAVVSGAASGDIALVLGENAITTEVTAQDGITKKTYTVTVTREHLLAPRHTVNLAKGAAAPGRLTAADLPDDAVIASFNPPATDDAGDLAFIAKWTSNNGKVKGTGLFLNDTCLAAVGGDASAIGGAGAKWKSFSDPVVDAGHVACIAKLSTGASAVVCNRTGAALEKIARTGEAATLSNLGPSANDPKYKSFKSVAVAGDTLAYLAQLTVGSGTPKVAAVDDAGIWFQGANNFVALRENQSDGARAIKTLVSFLPGNGSPGSGRGYLIIPPGNEPQIAAQVKFTDGSQGLVFQDVDAMPNFTVISRSGDSTGGLDTGATFASYGLPARNAAETTAFLGKLTLGVNVTKADAGGIFLGPNGGGKFATVVRVGGDAVSGAKFSVLKDPVLSEDGDLAFPATIKGGTVKGSAMQTLWWKPAGQPLALLAQGGADAGDLAGAKWKAFTSLAIAGDGRGPIFIATLVPNKTNVAKASATGVWAMDFKGDLRTLFRTGDQIDAGVPGTPALKKVKSFTLLKAAVGSTGVTRSFNDNALVVWLATFTDKTTAIVTTEVP